MLRQPIRAQSQTPPTQQNPNQLLTLPGFSGGSGGPNAQTGGGPNRPWWQRPIGIITILVVVLVLVLGGVFFFLSSRATPAVPVIDHVTQGNIALTISATGPLSTTSYSLAYTGNNTAKITEIDVKVGQAVKKGDVLAKVDQTALQNQVTKDQTQINADQIALGNAYASAGATSQLNGQNTTDANNGVTNAQTNQTNTNSQANASVSTAQTNLDQAQTDLDNARTSADLSKKQAKTARDNTINTQCKKVETPTPSGPPPAGVTPTPAPSVTVTDQTCVNNANATYNAAVNTADTSVTTAEQKVQSMQLALSTAELTAAQNRNTAAQNVQAAQSKVNSTSANNTSSSATSGNAVSNAQKALQTDQLTLQLDQINLSNATLTAPHDGVITAINGAVGGLPGSSTSGSASSSSSSNATPFMQLVDLASLQVNASVNESDTANLQVGQPAIFTVNAYGDARPFRGTVSAISPQGTTTSNVVTYPVTINIDPASTKGATLYPNMTANVTITVVQRNNVLEIPVQAINFARQASSANPASTTPRLITPAQARTAMTSARQMSADLIAQNPNIVADSPTPAYVIVSIGNNQYAAKPVVVGITDGTSYEVLSGLQPNDAFVSGINTGTRGAAAPAGGGGGNGGGGNGGGGNGGG